MYAAPDAVMSGLRCMGVKFLYFATRIFGYCVSKDIGLCGRGLLVLVVWLNVGCFRWCVCIDAGVLKMSVYRWSYDRLFRGHCVDGVVCVC